MKMTRLPAFTVAIVLATLSWNCGPNSQQPSNCTYTVSLAQHPGTMFHGTGVPAAGGDYSVDVLGNPPNCAVPTYTADSWITITQETPDRGLGYRITAAANTGGSRRTGTAYVGYQPLIVDQAGMGGSGCTFQTIPSSTMYTTAGATAAFAVVPSDQKCGWRAEPTSTGEDWSTEPSPARGVGNAALVFTVKSSTAAPQPPLPRQAEVRVSDSAGSQVGTYAYSQQ
jgi:hypothetical protein